jgi:hypothetical protein
MDADKVIELDKRSIFRIFYNYLLLKYIWFYTFIYGSISHPFYLRISLFFFFISNTFCINAILFTDDIIDIRNVEKNKILVNVTLYFKSYYFFNLFLLYKFIFNFINLL